MSSMDDSLTEEKMGQHCASESQSEDSGYFTETAMPEESGVSESVESNSSQSQGAYQGEYQGGNVIVGGGHGWSWAIIIVGILFLVAVGTLIGLEYGGLITWSDPEGWYQSWGKWVAVAIGSLLVIGGIALRFKKPKVKQD